ncbi:MAG: caspase family protein [Nostoc sp. CmiVER01]|uniref:caspase family protein n=1 Tax=Nostoc sp. CmiVER01 TaxID=3075384 RepID=UPI002AD48923|nr:caspase family protein [Nostoc sp. CmiVER01]MDZ8126769.1 caspase family protein [Nostoc sp. CmiVER01]
MKREALIVGINQYPFLKNTPTSKAKHLTTPATDAEAIAQLLEADDNFQVQRLPKREINGKIQVDPNGQVSLGELSREINKLFCSDNNRDTALLFFAGHGLQQLNSLGNKRKISLATSDTKGTGENSILLNDLWELLEESPVKEQIIWLDSCYSGGLLEFQDSDLPRRISGLRRFIIAASHSSEVAYARLNGKHGVLSGALIEGLDPSKIPQGDWITDRTLADFVERELKIYYEQTKIPQIPQIRRSDHSIKLILGQGEKHQELEHSENTLLHSSGLSSFVSWEDFFREWLNTKKPFNHAWRLVGRTDYLQNLNDFVQSEEQKIVILPGRGGIGKTKLLLAFAEQFNNSNLTLWFVEEGVPITAQNVVNLPKNNCVVVLDDAHRREEDVAVLLTFFRQNHTNKLIVSCRPYGVEYLQAIFRQAGIDSRQIKRLDELKELSRDDVKALANQALGENYADLVDKLATVTKDCPLVTVVGGRLLAEKAILPSLLERDEDFQYNVITRFRDAILGQIGQKLEPEFCKELLKLIAAVAPMRLSNEQFKQVAAEFLQVSTSKLVSSVGILEQSGILLRRGGILRITPDVLADHILYEACLTAQGESTGYIQELFNKFKSVCLAELLKNFAELDWRIRYKSRKETDLLANIWHNIWEDFRSSSNYDRCKWLNVIKTVAYYQPRQALEIVEFAIRNPTTISEDESIARIYCYTHNNVLVQLPEILKTISYTLTYLPSCCELLWELRKSGGIGVLQKIASYDIKKSVKFNQIILVAVTNWLRLSNQADDICFLLDILDQFLVKSSHSEEFESFTLTFTPFAVSFQNTQQIREQALQLIINCTKATELNVVIRAVKSLENALRKPVASFGREITLEEEQQWIPEQLKILDNFSSLIQENINPLVNLSIINALLWHTSYNSFTKVKRKAKKVLKSIPKSFELKLTAALRHSYDWDWLCEQEKHSSINSDILNKRAEGICLHIAKELLQRYPDATEGMENISAKLEDLVGTGVSPFPYTFLGKLSQLNPSYTEKICEKLIANPDSPLTIYLYSLLFGVINTNYSQAIAIVQRGVDTDHPTLCQAIAGGYFNIDITNKLLNHSNLTVKQLTIGSLPTIYSVEPRLAIETALQADIDNSTELASRLCQVFDKYAISPDVLKDEELIILLNKLEPVQNIEEYHISEFLAYASTRTPRSLINLLLRRIKRFEEAGEQNYQPLPYIAFHHGLDGLANSNEYEDILRDIRQEALIGTYYTYFWIPKLFEEASLGFNSISLKVLEEWINSKDITKIKTVSLLLSDAYQGFVFQHIEFVRKLIEQAYTLGDECYRTVKGNLLKTAISGDRSRAIGLPAPADITLEEKASTVAAQFIFGSATYKFYNYLSKYARTNIQDDLAYDEEFD